MKLKLADIVTTVVCVCVRVPCIVTQGLSDVAGIMTTVCLCVCQGAVRHDPRFDDLSGEFRETHFKQSYSFISDIRRRGKQISNISTIE